MRFPLPALTLVLCWSFVTTATAREWIVALTGNDTASGTTAAPFKTIQHACDLAKPDDTVIVTAGTYHEKLQVKVSGTEDAPITIKGEPGAILSGKGVDGDHMVLLQNRSYVHVVGLEIRDLKAHDGSGIRVLGGGAGIQLRHNRIHEIRGRDAMGITIYGTDASHPITGLVIDGNEIYDCDPAKSEALTLNGNIDGFKIINNSVHDLNNIGIDMIGGEAGTVGVARNGVCSSNAVARCRARYGDGYAAGIYVDGGQHITVENNTVTQCDLGIEVGAENKGTITTAVRVRGNLIYHNDKAGLVFGGYDKNTGRVRNCSFTGNTCFQNNRHKNDHNGELWLQWADDNVVTGNFFVVNGSDSPLVSVDRGTGANKISGNRYYTDAGEADAFFFYKETDVNGFAAWKRTTGWDADSTFGPVEIKLPE